MASSSSAAEMSMGVESTAQPPPPVADEREGEGEKELWEKKFLALKRRCDEFEQLNDAMFARTKKISEMIAEAEAEKTFLVRKLERYEVVALPRTPTPPPSSTTLHPTPRYSNREPHIKPAKPDHCSLTPYTLTSSQPSPQQPINETPSSRPTLEVAVSPAGKGTSATASHAPKKTAGADSGTRSREQATKSKRRKADAVLGAPKKPSNAFFWFCQEHRPTLQEHFRGEGVAGQHDLTKVLAKLWSQVSADDKKKYYERYVQDKQRYERELQEYTAKQQQQAAPPPMQQTAPPPLLQVAPLPLLQVVPPPSTVHS